MGQLTPLRWLKRVIPSHRRRRSPLYFPAALAHFGACMTRFGFNSSLFGLLVLLLAQPGLQAETTNEAPDFKEVYDLIHEHLSGVSDAELNRAAVEGLLTALGPRVELVSNRSSASGREPTAPLSKAAVFDGRIAYLRIAAVNEDLSGALSERYEDLASTNKVNGVVLDLRYADGHDYASVAPVVDLFVSRPEPLLNWGDGMVSSHGNTNAIRLPIAVLVNHETSRAAEALAGVLRETGAALILGSRTAGQAMVTRDFPLKNGELLRIAVSPITLGNGSKLSADGLAPDIEVGVSPQKERAYYADSYLAPTNTQPGSASGLASGNEPGATNENSRRVRLNEAELVREHREGLDQEMDSGVLLAGPPEPEKPVVTDPALARALDLLKGLAVVRQNRF